MNTSKGVHAMVRVFLAGLFALAFTVSASAQTYLTTTTNSSAVDATQTSITLAAVTGLAAGAAIYVDRELMTVRSVSGLIVTVNRGQSGTVANAHGASRTVILIPAAAVPTVISAVAPSQTNGVGTCTPSNHRYLPIINPTTGNVWTCRWLDNVRVWAATNATLITYNSLIMQ